MTSAVDVGGIDEGNAKVECPVDGGHRVIPVGVPVPLAHPHAAQSLGRDGQLCQRDLSHICSYSVNSYLAADLVVRQAAKPTLSVRAHSNANPAPGSRGATCQPA